MRAEVFDPSWTQMRQLIVSPWLTGKLLIQNVPSGYRSHLGFNCRVVPKMKFITSESHPACSTSGDPSPSIPIQVEAEYHTPGIALGGGHALGTVHSLSTHFICFPCGACTT